MAICHLALTKAHLDSVKEQGGQRVWRGMKGSWASESEEYSKASKIETETNPILSRHFLANVPCAWFTYLAKYQDR